MTSFWTRINRRLQNARQWYEGTPERALDQAYDAALMIKAIEDEHFDGNPISNIEKKYSDNTFAYFQSELKKYLKIAEIRLSEFKTSRSFFSTTDPSASARPGMSNRDRERTEITLEKLKFIDDIIDRYKPKESTSLSLVPISQTNRTRTTSLSQNDLLAEVQEKKPAYSPEMVPEDDSILDKTGVLPRSILGTLNRIKRDLDPSSEQQVVQSFRTTKAKTLISIRFLLLLIIVPLLTQQLTKIFIVSPIVENIRHPEQAQVFLNSELEEEALNDLRTYEERLRFDSMIGRPPKLTGEQEVACRAELEGGAVDGATLPGSTISLSGEQVRECLVRERAVELAKENYRQGSNAIANVFSDVFSLIAFAIVILVNQREVVVLKSFLDETIYGLSDSAKAFIIILFTDMFVGFHSPHGWEILLEGVAKHFGLPPNRDFIFLFIATFPVILDTIFKYWIFRYLNRISPSAVATYRNMNE
ncbi:proton extrusion protein PcxA [Leptothermofonsia sp. ETS-13]|uniref:proton extrusion protein PcxA n=1 Tax=Leptothermofonsia sp. ETS-13 TaxID=3035696 RepID=UPI003BA01232